MLSMNKKMDAIDLSMSALHAKMDTLVSTFHENFVSKGEFDEWKKNRVLERIVLVLVTAAISGLISFFLREKGI